MRSISSEPAIHENLSDTISRPWKTSLNLHECERVDDTDTISSAVIVKKPPLRFDSAVRVILIPTRKEYRAAGLGDLLWWKESEYSAFKGSAIMELRVILSLHDVNPKVALQRLYQPESMFADLEANGIFNRNLGKCSIGSDIGNGGNSNSNNSASSNSSDASCSSSPNAMYEGGNASSICGSVAGAGAADEDENVSAIDGGSGNEKVISNTTEEDVTPISSPTTRSAELMVVSPQHRCNTFARMNVPENVFEEMKSHVPANECEEEIMNPYMKMLVTADESLIPAVTPMRWKAASSGGRPSQAVSSASSSSAFSTSLLSGAESGRQGKDAAVLNTHPLGLLCQN
mgnify:CR=1 FL=1